MKLKLSAILVKRIIPFVVGGSLLSVAFMNCSPGFEVAQMRTLSSSGSLGLDPVLDLSFSDSTQDITTSDNPSVAFSVHGTDSNYKLKCFVNSVQTPTCESPMSLSTMKDGDISLRIVAESTTGRTIKEVSKVVRLDRQAPVLTVTSKPAAQIGTQNTSVSFSAVDNVSSAAEITVQCALDAAAFATCTSPRAYTGLSIGAHTIKLKALDKSGNTSPETAISFSISIGIPTVTISQAPASFINVKTANFVFAGTSSDSTIASYECSIDNGVTYTACTSPKSYSNLTDGVYNFAVRAKDSLNQLSGAATNRFTVDTALPSTPVVASNLMSPTNQVALNLTFSSADSSGIASFQCSLDAATFAACASPKPYTALTSGSHTFKVKATDQAGNVSAEGSYTLVIDTAIPVLSITANPTNPSTDINPSFSFSATDALSGVSLTECLLDTEAAYTACTSPKTYSNVTSGNRTFTVRATDKAGNSAVQNYSWSLASVTAPTPTPTPGGGGGPLTSIDTGTDPVFAEGGATLTLSGAQVSVKANRAVTTAAGVYNSSGTLIRTLWRKVDLAQGQTTSMTWDYRDDFGQTVADAAYQVKVIAHNVGYKWQGVIGNTSHPGAAGAVSVPDYPLPVIKGIYRGFGSIQSMAFGPNGASIYTVGYNEAWHPVNRGDVGTQKSTWLGKADFQRVFDHVATDGVISYAANSGMGKFLPPCPAVSSKDDPPCASNFDMPENFIVGFKVSDNSDHIFSAGIPWTHGLSPYQNVYDSVIDTSIDGSADKIRGLAVEVNGTNLYVAHQASGIKILNKTTGACKVPVSAGVCGVSIAIPNVYDIALSPNGDLWVSVGRTEIRRYTNPGTNPTLAMTIKGFTEVLGLAISPITQTLVVADGGASQQLKGFNSQTGAALWTHGAKGGYNSTNGADVTPNKLYLSGSPSNFAEDRNYVAFEPSATEEIFWVSDYGNSRNLKFKIPANPAAVNPLAYLDQILFVTASYTMTVDKTDPTRVFSNWMEFKVDYSKPIDKSWTLVRNYNYNLSAAYDTGGFSGPKFVQTYQGHTYAMVHQSPSPGIHYNIIVELTASGIRETGVQFDGSSLEENMSVRYGKKANGLYTIYQRNMTGIDANNNPIYGAETVVASAPLTNPLYNNPYHGGCYHAGNSETFPKTSTNMIITYNPCEPPKDRPDLVASDTSHHLGGIKVGAGDYGFRASPGGKWTPDSNGLIVNLDGTFNNPDVWFASSRAMAAGRNVIYGYFGEGWNGGQSNQWIHYLDNGLFVGQFGTPNYNYRSRFQIPVGTAGNAFSPHMVTVDGNIYVYHNDENAHSGVHRWRLTNMNSLEEVAGNIGKNVTVTNPAGITSKRMPQQ